MRKLVGLLVAAMLLGALAPAGSASQRHGSAPTGLGDCARYLNLQDFRNRKLEVCWAYIVNVVDFALVPYYTFSTAGSDALNQLMAYRLSSRYATDQARQKFVQRVAHWPHGLKRVNHHISIISEAPDESHNRGSLVTREDWTFQILSGETLTPQEQGCLHRILIARTPGISYVYVPFLHRSVGLHKWVVTGIQDLAGQCS